MKFLLRLLAAVALVLPALSVRAQQAPAVPAAQSQDSNAGPNTDNSSIIVPKKKESDEPPPPPAPSAPKVKNPDNANFSMRVDVPLVTIDANVVLDKTHQFVPGLSPGNFLVIEDGVPQKIDTVRVTQQPITAVLLLEYAANNYYYINDMLNTAISFLHTLKQEDYVAVVTYDLKTHILTDFTSDKMITTQAIRSLAQGPPLMSDTNMFDALYESLDRVTRIDGRKYIVLVGTGRDTFSKITLDKIYAKVKATPNVTIFTISTGNLVRELNDTRGGMAAGMQNLVYLQAQNQMNTFASMTGGMSFAPLFPAELPDDFNVINNSIRNKYVITYRPTNPANDGSYRKVKVSLVDQEGKPLKMVDEKGKQVKYNVIARDGYTAKRPVE